MKLDDILATLNESILLHSNGDKQLAAKVLKEIKQAAEEEKADRVSEGPKGKNALTVLLDDSENLFSGRSFMGWVVQMPAEDAPMLALDRARAAGKAFNETKKGRKRPVKSISEVFSSVPRKLWKNGSDIKTMSKTKTKILIQPTSGELI